MKVTSVTVVLVSLLALCSIVFSAPDCGSNGVQVEQYCSCFSGYAPKNYDLQNDCYVNSMCPAHDPVDTRTSTGGFQPILYNASFVADRYKVIVRVPLVVGRRNATVRLSGGASSCGYPGNLWHKKANDLDCVDELYGQIPWASNGLCGFKKTVAGNKAIYSAGLLVSYDDLIRDSEGDFIRTSGVLLNINVTFVTRTSVIYSLINLSPGMTLVQVTVIGNVIYDANTRLATVTLRTTATWPYMVSTIAMFSAPGVNQATISPDILYDVASGCTNVTNTKCVQQLIMRVDPTTGCNLGGHYVFNITLVCRQNSCAGNYKAGAYSVLIYDTDVCGVGGIDVSLANGALVPFADAAGTTPASSFLPNKDVYFAFTLSSDAVTIDSMIVEKIYAATSSVEDVLYDLNPVGTAPGVTAKGTAAELSITPAITPASPGFDATIWFHVKLVDAITSFRVLPDAASTVTVSIIVNIQYHGNTKRMELTGKMSTSSSKGMTDLYLSTSDGVDPGSNLLPDDAATTQVSLFITFTLVLLLILNF